MAPSFKICLQTTQSDLARALTGAFENLIDPPPDAVTQFEDGPNAWRIEAYYSGAPDIDALALRLKSVLGQAVPPPELASVPDLNWVAISQAALPPVEAGRFLVHGAHDRARVARGPNAILIEAGEAFGTAHHATTLGCLLTIDRLARSRTFARVLDLGCGSGVLAIAAARALPRADILAADSDPQAIRVAVANAKANGAGQRIAFVLANGLAHPWLRHVVPFDLIIANILAGPLRALAADIDSALRRGGILVLSGILHSEAPAVIATYRARGFALLEHRRIAGWSTLTLRKCGHRPPRVVEPTGILAKTPTPRIAGAQRGA